MTGFGTNNFYTEDKAFDYAKTLSNDYQAQVANKLFKRSDLTGENFDIRFTNEDRRKELRRELWAIKTSKTAETLIYDLAASTIYRGDKEPNLFQILEQGAKGKSPQSQAIVNNFTSLAIESIPDLRRENDTEKLKKMLQDPKYKNQVVQILSDVLQVPAEDLTPYLTSDRFRLKIIAD